MLYIITAKMADKNTHATIPTINPTKAPFPAEAALPG